jgi:hypothetical protein
MKKITKQMALNLRNGVNRKDGNTQVNDNALYLHGNKIVDLLENKLLVLNSRGWRTNTTKERLNGVLEMFGTPYKIYQKNFQWFLFNTETKQSTDFFDGITLNAF